mmetsp:Transcript_48188/g.112745  ORF Transcript_48188/g.112745 Transcript_48188/m.112745 type:complete len:241 (-) Transcript_48188:71-793(-)
MGAVKQEQTVAETPRRRLSCKQSRDNVVPLVVTAQPDVEPMSKTPLSVQRRLNVKTNVLQETTVAVEVKKETPQEALEPTPVAAVKVLAEAEVVATALATECEPKGPALQNPSEVQLPAKLPPSATSTAIVPVGHPRAVGAACSAIVPVTKPAPQRKRKRMIVDKANQIVVPATNPASITLVPSLEEYRVIRLPLEKKRATWFPRSTFAIPVDFLPESNAEWVRQQMQMQMHVQQKRQRA